MPRTSAGTRLSTARARKNGMVAWSAHRSVSVSNAVRMAAGATAANVRVDMSATISAPACASRIAKENPAATMAAVVHVAPVRQVMPVTGRAIASVCRNARTKSVATMAVVEPAASVRLALSATAKACAKSSPTSAAMDSVRQPSAKPARVVRRIVVPASSVATVFAIRRLKTARVVPGTAVHVAEGIVASLMILRVVMTRMSRPAFATWIPSAVRTIGIPSA